MCSVTQQIFMYDFTIRSIVLSNPKMFFCEHRKEGSRLIFEVSQIKNFNIECLVE